MSSDNIRIEYYITKDVINRTVTEPINIINNSVISLSSNPVTPSSPPVNTPPNINTIRELYLNYISSFEVK